MVVELSGKEVEQLEENCLVLVHKTDLFPLHELVHEPPPHVLLIQGQNDPVQSCLEAVEHSRVDRVGTPHRQSDVLAALFILLPQAGEVAVKRMLGGRVGGDINSSVDDSQHGDCNCHMLVY